MTLHTIAHMGYSELPAGSERGWAMDFFISYTKADLAWAEWIAWQLEESGLQTILQTWDFHAGCNFILEMDSAAKQAQRTIAVLSTSYVSAAYTHPEWASALARDPTGQKLFCCRSASMSARLRGCWRRSSTSIWWASMRSKRKAGS
jgi:TIR domain